MLTNAEQIRDDVEIGWMLARHHPQCAAISQQEGGYNWEASDFAEYVADENSLGLVAIFEEVIVGFICYRIADVFVIDNMGVDSIFKRLGIGGKLVSTVCFRAGKANLGCCAAVPERNLHAQQFLRKHGYKATHIAGAKTPQCSYVFEISPDRKVAADE